MPTYDAGDARLRIVPDAREFRAKLEADLRKINAEYAVQVSADLARARTEIDKFRAEQQANAINLRVRADNSHARSKLDEVSRDVERIGGELGKQFKLNLEIAGLSAIPIAITGLTELAAAIQQVSQAGLALPGIFAGGVASIGTLAVGLTGVKDAYSAITKEAATSGQNQAEHAREAAAATNQLRNAVVDEAQAQRDVANARKDARQQLEDLNLQLRGGALDERQAQLDALKARQDLATGHYQTAVDYQEAQLRVEQADERVAEAHQRNIELQDKASDANAKGVNNADNVVAANERLTRSHQGVADAQANMAEQAQRAGGAADKAAEAMAKLSPNARDFVQTLVALKPQIQDLRNLDSQNLFAGLSQRLRTLASQDLPVLRTGLGAIATAWNQNLGQLMTSLGSDQTRGLLDRLLGDTASAQSRFTAAIGPIIHAVGVLSDAGADTLPRLADAVGHVADRFDHFISAADKDGRLAKWISDGETGLTHLGDTMLNIGKSFTAITQAAGGGQSFLQWMDNATNKLQTFLNSTQGQNMLRTFFAQAREEFDKWKPILHDLPGIIGNVITASRQWMDQWLPLLREAAKLLHDDPKLVEGVFNAFLAWKTITGVTAVVESLTKITTLLTGIPALAGGAGTALGGLGAAGGAAGAGGAAASATAGTSGVAGALGEGIPLVGIPVLGGVAAGAVQDRLDRGKTAPLGGDPGVAQRTTRNLTQADAAKLTVPPNVPKPGSTDAEQAMSGLAKSGDKAAIWVVSTNNKWDQAARYAWLMNHQDADNPNFAPPGSYYHGGPTPDGPGPLDSKGGYPAVIHPKEWMLNARGRSVLGDDFLAKANMGMVDISKLPKFFDGGPGDAAMDAYGNPDQSGPPGPPAPVAPNPYSGGGIPGIIGAIGQGVQGPIGNAFSFGSSMLNAAGGNRGAGGSGGGGGGLGGAMVPGVFGLLQAGGNPQALQSWGMQTGQWLANWGANTLTQFGTTLFQGLLGGLGLQNSVLSSGNSWNQAIMGGISGIGSHFAPLLSGIPGMAGAAPGLGSQSITLGDGSTIQIPTFGSAGVPDVGAGLSDIAGAAAPNGAVIAANPASKALSVPNAPNVEQGIKSIGGLPTLYPTSGDNAYKVPDWVNQLAGSFGLTASTYSGGGSLHQMGFAFDFNGAPQNMDAFADFIKNNLSGQTLQLIHASGDKRWGIASGQDVSGGSYYAGDYGGHFDHVHWATDAPVLINPQNLGPGGIPGAAAASAANTTSGAAALPTGLSPIKQLAAQAYLAAGLPPDQFDDFNKLITKESGWSTTAKNPNSTAYGLGQFLDTTWASVGGTKTDDPSQQLAYVFAYLKQRYGGSPSQAWSHEISAGWYDDGGYLPQGLTVVHNNTGQPEPVLTPQQNAALQAVANTSVQQMNPSAGGQQVQHMQTPKPSAGAAPQPGAAPAPAPPPPIPPAAVAPEQQQPTLPQHPLIPPTGIASGSTGTGIADTKSLDHVNPALKTTISSTASTLGNLAATAMQIGASVLGAAGGAGAAPSFGGSLGASAGAAALSGMSGYVAGLFTEGGKVVEDIANVPSSFLVGTLTDGTSNRASGETLKPQQNTPVTAQSQVQNNTFNGMDIPSVFQELDMRQAQQQQAALAAHRR